MRIGLHSGEVVVRAIGNDLSMDYDAIGPTVHLASRMEQLASPGTVRLTAATANLAEGFVDLRSLGQVPVKGLSQPIEAFDLLGVGAARTRLQASAGRGLTPFVGRQDEVAALDRAQRAGRGRAGPDGRPCWRSGRRQVATVLRIHAQRADAARGWCWKATSVSSGRASSWAPVIDLLKTLLRHCAWRRSAPQRREGARQDHAAGRCAAVGPAGGTLPARPAGRECRLAGARAAAATTAHPGRCSRHCSCAKASGSRLPWCWTTCTGSTAKHRRCWRAWSKACTPVACCCLSTTVPNIDTTGVTGPITRNCASIRSRREDADELLTGLLGDAPELSELKHRLLEASEGNPLFLEESVRILVDTGVLSGPRGAYRMIRRRR